MADFTIQARVKSFRYAIAGMWHVIRHEHNAWIHLLATVLVFLFALWLNISRIEWAVVILAMGAVWLGESVNTAVEAVVDELGTQTKLTKVAKDTAAGGVLFAAICAAVVGFIILGPPLWEKVIG